MTQKTKTGELCWTELATTNVQAAKDFYGKLFGWTFTDQEMGDATYTIITINDKNFGGIWSIPKDQQKHIPPHWMNYILVENIDESVEKARQYGAAIVKPVSEVCEMGRMAVITDPTGAHIALWEAGKC